MPFPTSCSFLYPCASPLAEPFKRSTQIFADIYLALGANPFDRQFHVYIFHLFSSAFYTYRKQEELSYSHRLNTWLGCLCACKCKSEFQSSVVFEGVLYPNTKNHKFRLVQTKPSRFCSRAYICPQQYQ